MRCPSLRSCRRPEKIVCVGMNYQGHIAEMSRERLRIRPCSRSSPRACSVPTTTSSSLAQPGGRLGSRARSCHRSSTRTGHARARPAMPLPDSPSSTMCLCVTGRTALRSTYRARLSTASTPVGPDSCEPDEIDDAADLEVRCEVDGVAMQCGRTSDMLFGPAEIVSYISQFATLTPGDLISTGTPAGVGAGRSASVPLTWTGHDHLGRSDRYLRQPLLS